MSKNVNKKYIILILIVLLGSVSVYIGNCYGLFTKDALSNYVFSNGKFNYKLENDDLVDNSVIVGACDSLELTLNLKSKNWIYTNYELYYLVDGEKNSSEKIEIGYTEESIDKVKGVIKARDKKQITLKIKNQSDKSVKITFGCEGSKINNELVMSEGSSLNNLIMNNNSILAYTYVGTGTSPATFPNIGEGYHVTNLSCTGGTAEWDNDTWKMKVLTTTGTSLVCNATITALYKDASGASIPIIKGDLVPVIVSDTGAVTKANIYEEWYDYDAKTWANAVILNDGYGPYENGATIPEEAIESYFVWIPRYKYKIFNTGSYSALGTRTSAEQEIEIVFEDKKTAVSSGTAVDTWLTHPAFTSFDSDGMWVGKFETGYRGATSTDGALYDISNANSSIIIKPNVFSWRGISVGNAFDNCYKYNRENDSHMMKNTEWGAVAYLSHSKYGYVGRVRINNNKQYVTGFSAKVEPTKSYNAATSIDGNRIGNNEPGTDGTHTLNYLNVASVVSSTTGNYSGIYDMCGGAIELVMGYTTGASTVGGSSNITTLYADFFTNSDWDKYYDKYTSTAKRNYNYRILGDATGEMGPFANTTDLDDTAREKSSWYFSYSRFIGSAEPWFRRGGNVSYGKMGSIFTFVQSAGASFTNQSFRVVLTPQYK